MSRKMRALAILMILFLSVQPAGMAAAATDCGGGPAEPAPGLDLTVSITEDSVEAAPSESAPGTAQFHGTVTVQMPSLRGATVTLTSSTDIGWVTQVAPGTFVLDNGQVGEFTVTVVVPQGSPASLTGNVIVNGRAVASGVQATGSDSSTITVRPDFRVVLEAQKREVEISPGGTARFSLRVTNAGNSVDSFEIRSTNQNELERQGWKVSVPNAGLKNVVPGEYRLVTVVLAAPASMSPYSSRTTTLNIRATSLGAQEHNLTTTLDYPLSVKETGVSGTGVSIVAVIAVVMAVGVFVYWRRRRLMKNRTDAEEPSLPEEERT